MKHAICGRYFSRIRLAFFRPKSSLVIVSLDSDADPLYLQVNIRIRKDLSCACDEGEAGSCIDVDLVLAELVSGSPFGIDNELVLVVGELVVEDCEKGSTETGGGWLKTR